MLLETVTDISVVNWKLESIGYSALPSPPRLMQWTHTQRDSDTIASPLAKRRRRCLWSPCVTENDHYILRRVFFQTLLLLRSFGVVWWPFDSQYYGNWNRDSSRYGCRYIKPQRFCVQDFDLWRHRSRGLSIRNIKVCYQSIKQSINPYFFFVIGGRGHMVGWKLWYNNKIGTVGPTVCALLIFNFQFQLKVQYT